MKTKTNSLNIFKGILIFAIVILHSKETFNESINGFRVFYNWGGFIVNSFFFTASGFGIYKAYSSRLSNGTESAFRFIWKRIVKIYPMYFITEVIMFLFTFHADGMSVLNAKEILLNIFMMTTGWVKNVVTYNGQCWFISVLMLMYVVFAIIEKLFKRNDKYVYIILLVIGCFLMWKPINKPFTYYDNGIGLACFSVGCLLAIFYEKYVTRKSETVILTLAALLICALIIVFSTIIGFDTGAIQSQYAFVFLIGPGLLLLAINPFIDAVIGNVSILKNTVGIISMNVFFWHIIILRVYNAICLKVGLYESIGMSAAYIVYLTLTFLICYGITVLSRRFKIFRHTSG